MDMIISVDTEKDSVESLRRAVSLLQELLAERDRRGHDVLAELPKSEERVKEHEPPKQRPPTTPIQPHELPKADRPGVQIFYE